MFLIELTSERYGMNRAADVAQPDRPDRHGFDDAGMTGDLDHITRMDRILQQDKHAGNHVLDQGLRPEPNGESNHAGTGQ